MGAKKKLSTAFLLGVCMFCLQGMGWAQENRGGITGTVLDASGAVVPGVSITATDVAQGVKYPATSSSGGVYMIPNVTVGIYRVEAEFKGFKKFVVDRVEVTTGRTATVNINLQVGEPTQQVTVTATTAMLQTEDSQINYLMSHKMYQELPLTMNGNSIDGSGRRQANQFILLMPGVDTNIEGDTLGRKFNGSQYYSGLFKIDGVATTISIDAGQAEFYAPPYEAMQEFSVQTSNLPAELGGASGVESLTMKSGTNQIHGNLFEFHRDMALNAKGFNPVAVKSLFIQNEYGGSIGGPIYIPHLYNGHNRSFFFVSVGQFRNVGGPPNAPVYTVPTAAEHQGNFSQELSVLGTKIYNPATQTFVPGTGAGTGYFRTAFSNNIVGPTVSQAAYWLKWIALPNLPGTNSGLTSNFVDTVGTILHDNTWSVKIDHSFNDRHRLSYSYWGADRPNKNIADVYFTVPISQGFLFGGGQRLHDYHTISTNIQNDAYLGFSSYYQRSGVCAPGASLGDNPSGIPNLDYYNPGGTGQMRFTGTYFRSGGALKGCVPFDAGKYAGRNSNSAVAGDTVGWLHGKHNIKFGVEYTRELTTFRGLAGGNYTFAAAETNNPQSNANTGDAFASFLLGLSDANTTNGPNIGIQWHNPRMGAFVQDTWKVTSKFTVNYGLRWDRGWISTEAHQRVAGFSPTAINPARGIPGAEVFLGYGSAQTGTNVFPGQHPHNLQFGPRIGFAYALDSKTVIRAGYALMYTYGNGDAMGFDNGGTPWQSGIIKTSVSLASSNNGITPADTLQGGLPIPTCPLPCYNPNFANGGVPLLWDPNSGRDPYLQQWTFGVERYLPAGFFIQASYVANKGNNLTGDNDNWNQLPVSYLTTYGTLLTQPLANNPQLGIKAPYVGFTGSVGQALRPFPQYSGIADRFDPSGMNRYDSFQMSLRKTTGDLVTMINLTDAKNLTNVGSGAFNGSFSPGPVLDTNNFRLDKAVDPLTPLRRFVLSWLYSFPVGKGKRFAGGMPGWANQIIGNWQFGAIQTYRTGFNDGVGGGVATSGIFNTETRPNELAGVPIRLSGCNNIVLGSNVLANINAFAPNTSTTLGNAPRVLPNFRGCAWVGEDTTLQKQFPITEKVHFMIRVDVYNTFNHVKFADPALNINSPATFGKITSIDGNFQPREFQLSGKLTW
jgi:hypothetical protein